MKTRESKLQRAEYWVHGLTLQAIRDTGYLGKFGRRHQGSGVLLSGYDNSVLIATIQNINTQQDKIASRTHSCYSLGSRMTGLEGGYIVGNSIRYCSSTLYQFRPYLPLHI